MFAATLTAVVCAILQNCRDYDGIGQWLSEQRLDFRHALGFWRTPPTASGVRKLLPQIDAAALEAALKRWNNNLPTDGNSATGLVPITLDGKSLRGTWNRLNHAVHLLNVIDQRTKTVLHQRLVPGDTNEHKVALEVLPRAFAGSHRETSVFNRRCSSDGLCAFSEREFVSSSDRHRVLGHSMTDSASKLFNSQLKNRAVQSGLR